MKVVGTHECDSPAVLVQRDYTEEVRKGVYPGGLARPIQWVVEFQLPEGDKVSFDVKYCPWCGIDFYPEK